MRKSDRLDQRIAAALVPRLGKDRGELVGQGARPMRGLRSRHIALTQIEMRLSELRNLSGDPMDELISRRAPASPAPNPAPGMVAARRLLATGALPEAGRRPTEGDVTLSVLALLLLGLVIVVGCWIALDGLTPIAPLGA